MIARTSALWTFESILRYLLLLVLTLQHCGPMGLQTARPRVQWLNVPTIGSLFPDLFANEGNNGQQLAKASTRDNGKAKAVRTLGW